MAFAKLARFTHCPDIYCPEKKSTEQFMQGIYILKAVSQTVSKKIKSSPWKIVIVSTLNQLVDTLPTDLYGLFIFTEDLFFYNVHRGFRGNAAKTPVWSAYSFKTLSPVPTYSGKYAPLFDNTARTAVTVIRSSSICQSYSKLYYDKNEF